MTVDQKLDAIMEQIANVQLWQKAHDVAHKMIDRDVNEIRTELFGNGHPGIKERLQIQEQTCTSSIHLHRAIVGWQGAMRSIIVNVVSGAALAVLGWMLVMYAVHGQ